MTSETVLVVDDEPMILSTLARVLRHPGWTVEARESGEAGLECVLQLRPRVVISDFNMPGMNGLELLRQTRSTVPCARGIIITGDVTDALMKAWNAGEFTLITKPWHNEHLQQVVTKAFGFCRYTAPQPLDQQQCACPAPSA